MSPVAASVDEFLAAVAPDKRAALQELRKVIREAAPEATELINYGVPMFRLNGKNLVSYAAAKDHCSFLRPESGGDGGTLHGAHQLQDEQGDRQLHTG